MLMRSIWAAVSLWSLAAAAAAGDVTTITVDAEHSVGVFKYSNGVNGAPDLTYLGNTANGPWGPAVNVSAGYRAARIDLVRTHDSSGAADIDSHSGSLPAIAGPFGPPPEVAHQIDLNVIFPDLSADPADPRSYNFASTDRLITSIRALPADVLFRLGRSGMSTAPPPQDLSKYGEIIRHIVLHYNRGWANGFQNQVKYWEVWNEPDLGKIFWAGTAREYQDLYRVAALAIKAADSRALVGGPTIARINEPSEYREGFLAYVRDHKLPLDFFSWHWYSVDSGDAWDFAVLGHQMRALLDKYGFTHTLSVLDEWNYDFRELRRTPQAEVAAFVASSLIYMQDAAVDLQALYRADHDFNADGTAKTKTGAALIAWGRFADTPVRLKAQGGDNLGLAVLATRSADGNKINILVSNYQIPKDHRAPRTDDVMHEHGLFDLALLPRRTVVYPARDQARLEVSGLDSRRSYTVEHFRISASEDLELAKPQAWKGEPLTFDLSGPSVDLVVLTRQ